MRDDYEYPDHLRKYEALDGAMLEWASARDTFTQDEASAHANSISRQVAPGPRWLASAEARGLIQRHDDGMAGGRWYSVVE